MSQTSKPVAFHVPYRTGREGRYLEEALQGDRFAAGGQFSARSEALLRERLRVPRVLLTHSCTGALEAIAILLGLGPGDEVIVPSYTFSSTATAFARSGATIVFADVDPRTMMLDPDDVAERITSRTRVLCVVHYAGVPAPVEALGALCANRGVTLVEDAAQGLGAALGHRALGTFGRLAAFSFHETKNIHCGFGGALVINDPSLVERAEHVVERGTNRSAFLRGAVDRYTWVSPGSSYQMGELQAAFLLAQLESLDDNLRERLALVRQYRERLAPGAGPERFELQAIPADASINGHAFFLRLPSEERCESLRLALAAQGITAATHYVPLHTSPQGQRLGGRAGTLPNTERWAGAVLRLPLHHELSPAQVDQVCDVVLMETG